jgi:hypothetical protein
LKQGVSFSLGENEPPAKLDQVQTGGTDSNPANESSQKREDAAFIDQRNRSKPPHHGN